MTAPAPIGGLEKVVEALTVGHAAAGHRIHVAAVADNREDAARFLEPLIARGIEGHAIVAPGRAYLHERASIRSLCETIRPSVMHTHGYRPDVITSGVARGLRIPTVSTVHGFTGGSFRNRLYEALQVRAFRRFDAVVPVSRPLAELLRERGVPANRLHLILNGWSSTAPIKSRAEARAQLGLDGSTRRIAWLGRLTHEKGADVLLRALPLLDDGVSVSIIGDGRERAALASLATGLGVAGRVNWHGVVKGAGTLLGAFDVFVSSSRTEGTPIVLFEAMAAMTPIVATAVGGVPDVVDSECATLVPSEDPAALAAGIQDALVDRDSATTRSKRAKERLDAAFAVEPWLAAYVDLYREVIDTRSRRSRT